MSNQNQYTMNKRKVLELLKPKAKMLGFSRRELANVADAIMAVLPEDIEEADEERSINQKIDEYLPLLRVGQSAASRQASASTRSMVDADDELDDDERYTHKPRGNRHSDDEDDDFADAPRWAKRLARMFEQSSDSNIKRRAKVEALVDGMGNMGKHLLRDFDRHSFKSEDEWEDYFADLKDEIAEIRQEDINRGMEHHTRPVGARPGRMRASWQDGEEMSDEEVRELAKT